MPDDFSENRRIDDQLAAFTDQVLGHNTTSEPQLASEPVELRKLQEAVLRLKRAGAVQQPTQAFAARLRAVLTQEWLRAGMKSQPAQAHSLQTLLQDMKQRMGQYFERTQPRTLALQFAAAVVVLLVVGLLLFPPDSGVPLAGAAGTSAVVRPIVVASGALLIILVIWWMRPKGK